MRKKFWLAAILFSGLQFSFASSSMAVDGVNSVDQLLRKLSHTLQEQNYRGLFTYEYGGTLDTLEIVHLVDDGIEYERVQHLNGPSREFVRSGRSVDCVTPASQLLRGGLFLPGRKPIQINQYYDLILGGDERVAGRTGTVVRLVPKDQYRYGFTFSVDRATGFPMKTLIISDSRKVLERIQFVELDLDIDADTAGIDPGDPEQVAASSDHSHCLSPKGENIVAATGSDEAGAKDVALEWRTEWLPQGFVLSEQSFSEADGYQLTYTDGLASFSIFITPIGPEGPVPPRLAQRGATVALVAAHSLQEHPANIAIVGEVPPVTAERVALNLRPADTVSQ